ncbi:sugar phosphate nucleotidyltransferase [Acidimicrobiaceae bacterium]|nr:sugar phosphate nucleotidyltransferase [Acidimicrobiaceae bacterium]
MKNINHGIILAGGYGKRLYPITKVTNKHFLPIFDKPMIYYSLSILLLFKIENITIVCNPEDENSFQNLLKDGKDFGVNIKYKIQEKPEGIPHGIIKGLDENQENDFLVVLGDNFLYGREFYNEFSKKLNDSLNIGLFVQEVNNPSDYGIANIQNGKVLEIVEKPTKFISNNAVIGLYKFNKDFPSVFDNIKKSKRKEFEIVDIFNQYGLNNIDVNNIGRGTTWFDMGSFENFFNSSLFVKTIQERQGLLVSSPHEIAFNNGYIDREFILKYIETNKNSIYARSLNYLIR